MDAVATTTLSKSFGQREVIHGIELRVPIGALYGFLGPNGAGKTTTIRILLGLLRASAGSVSVLGRNPWHDGRIVREGIGYLPGDIALYPHITGRATLQFLAAARRIDAGAEIERLATLFDLELDKKVRSFSRGMKQKLGLIQALMHKPDLLILDEPTIALDPLIREILRLELRSAADSGRTVLFSSHTLSEVEELCDWVGILRDGRLIEQDRIESLRRRAVRKVDITFASESDAGSIPETIQVVKREGRRLVGRWIGGVDPLLQWLGRISVQDVAIAPPDLEDLFMTYYTGEALAARDKSETGNEA